MFSRSSSLTSLDLSKFNTSKCQNMSFMFYGCYSLASLNLYNFNTYKVRDMSYMFYNCSLLTSLNLSNFKTLEVIDFRSMFRNCINLEYINLINFDGKKLDTWFFFESMFYRTLQNIVICINQNNLMGGVLEQIKKISCYTIDCSRNWKSRQKKIINSNNECIERCNNSVISIRI